MDGTIRNPAYFEDNVFQNLLRLWAKVLRRINPTLPGRGNTHVN